MYIRRRTGGYLERKTDLEDDKEYETKKMLKSQGLKVRKHILLCISKSSWKKLSAPKLQVSTLK